MYVVFYLKNLRFKHQSLAGDKDETPELNKPLPRPHLPSSRFKMSNLESDFTTLTIPLTPFDASERSRLTSKYLLIFPSKLPMDYNRDQGASVG